MENLSIVGLVAAALLARWAVADLGVAVLNWHGAVLVLGGVLCAALVNYPLSQFLRAATCLRNLLFAPAQPALPEVSAEILRLAQMARAQGGLLALQNEGTRFMGGFLNRAILVAIAAREPARVRDILESEVRQRRIAAQEDANFFRTIGVLAPMFGLLGTLLGIILVLRSMTDPMKVGPAMALAVTASLYGIAFSNMLCVPLAGHIRTRAMRETRILELIIEGVLELMRGESVHLLELRLGIAAPNPAALPGLVPDA